MDKYFIAVDFDGTLVKDKFPEIGNVNHKGMYLLANELDKARKLNREPVVILWTCRTDREEGDYLAQAVEWCKKKGLQIDYVNENPESPYGDWQRKVFADVYIDDKAVVV